MQSIKILDAFTLKIIALVTMTIDHIGVILFPELPILRIIGRLSFVIFAYFIVNGYIYTRNREKHGLILLLYGILLEIPLKLYDSSMPGNIILTLALGYGVVYFLDKKNYLLTCLIALIPLIYEVDYGLYGVLLIVTCFIFFKRPAFIVLVNLILVFIFYNLNYLTFIQIYSTFGLLLVCLYNQQIGKKMKYFFYLYYPLHMVILLLISMVIN